MAKDWPEERRKARAAVEDLRFPLLVVAERVDAVLDGQTPELVEWLRETCKRLPETLAKVAHRLEGPKTARPHRPIRRWRPEITWQLVLPMGGGETVLVARRTVPVIRRQNVRRPREPRTPRAASTAKQTRRRESTT